jgi:hypothetical protein
MTKSVTFKNITLEQIKNKSLGMIGQKIKKKDTRR